MGNFFPDEALKYSANTAADIIVHRLEGVISPLPGNLKKCMLVAASKHTIVKGDWNGCAMNMASAVKSYGDAAEPGLGLKGAEDISRQFFCKPHLIDGFIEVWDAIRLSNETATQLLITALENVMSQPEYTKMTRIVSGVVWTNPELNDFKNELDSVKSVDDLFKVDVTEEQFCQMKELLSV